MSIGEWTILARSGCEIAERPVWDAPTASLLWVDIPTGRVHRSRPTAETEPWTDEVMQVGRQVGAVALRTDGGLIAAADSAFLFLDAHGRPDADPIPVDLPVDQQFNDAACDPAGRFLAGTNSTVGADGGGVLLSLDPLLRCWTLLEGITESNGLGWSADGNVFYYVDSGEPVIRRYDYDVEHGLIGARLADLAVFDAADGVPDGLVVDDADAVWVAMWGGGALRRYAPDGALLAHVSVPATQPTCPGFAGPDLDLLVVTSGWEGLTSQERAADPSAGDVFVMRGPVVGRQPLRFGGIPPFGGQR
jgi:sugar lactone lactonase YvrE